MSASLATPPVLAAGPAGAVAGDWHGLVVFCAGIAWGSNRGTDQHVAERLSRYAPVLYVDPAVSPIAARRNPALVASAGVGRIDVLAPRLARLTPPALPGHTRPLLRAVTDPMLRRSIRRAVAALGGDVSAVVAATLEDVFSTAGERWRLLYATDDFVAGASLMGLDPDLVARKERSRISEADVLVTVSETAARRWRALGREVHVVPNGCDVAHFATADTAPIPADADLPHPVAGVVGHLSPRIDVALLEAVADAGVSLLLVGPVPGHLGVGAFEGLLGRPNVRWVGPKPYAELPGYLRALDVGLVPYADTPFNRASFPLKTLEYLAAGTPVVATDLPAVRDLGAGAVRVASSPADFAAAVVEAAAVPSDPAAVASRRAVAASSSWDARVAEIARLLGLPTDVPRAPSDPGSEL